MLLVYIINSKGTVRPLFPRINVIALVVSLRFLLQTSARNQQEPHAFGDGASKRPCAYVIFPVSSFTVRWGVGGVGGWGGGC